METLAERIALAVRYARTTQSSLAQAVGISGPSINQWFSGKTKSIEYGNAVKAGAFLGVNPDWLATGEGQMLDDDKDRKERYIAKQETVDKIAQNFWYVPLTKVEEKNLGSLMVNLIKMLGSITDELSDKDQQEFTALLNQGILEKDGQKQEGIVKILAWHAKIARRSIAERDELKEIEQLKASLIKNSASNSAASLLLSQNSAATPLTYQEPPSLAPFFGVKPVMTPSVQKNEPSSEKTDALVNRRSPKPI
jgi:transcriptional regulator with XRE-family HTH domain